MKTIRFFLLISLLISCRELKTNEEIKPFSNFLKYGSFNVGFKTLYTLDLSREDVPYSDWNGRLYSDELGLEGRSLPIHLWYPAKEITKNPLTFEHFVKLITRKSEGYANAKSDSLAKQIYINQTNTLKGDISFKEEDLIKLLNLKTKSSINSPAIENTFPLIIFPNGTSPAYQSIMCEFLASHGYIVAALPLKGRYSHVLDASVRGLEVAVDDIEFALQQLLALPNVNKNQIALLANAIESSFCAGLVSRNKKIKALVSLDGGFLSQFEQQILDETNFYEPQSLTIPILSIYAPHPAISPDYILDLKYSERYFAHFPKMSEFHFLNYGVFDEYVPEIIGETNGKTKEGFRIASELILSFLNAKLKNETKSLDLIYSGNDFKDFEIAIDTLYKLDGMIAPPNLAFLKNLFINKGMKSLDSVYNVHASKGDKQPFSMKFYKDFKDWLAWKKDSTFIHRKHLYEIAVESFPNSSLNNYYLAHYLKKIGEGSLSKKYYLQALGLIDIDSSIDQDLKAEIKENIANDLK